MSTLYKHLHSFKHSTSNSVNIAVFTIISNYICHSKPRWQMFVPWELKKMLPQLCYRLREPLQKKTYQINLTGKYKSIIHTVLLLQQLKLQLCHLKRFLSNPLKFALNCFYCFINN